jgi:hypothetical protein
LTAKARAVSGTAASIRASMNIPEQIKTSMRT